MSFANLTTRQKILQSLATIALVSLQAALFCLWQFGDLPEAGNVFLGIVATGAVVCLVANCAYIVDDDGKMDSRTPPSGLKIAWLCLVRLTYMLALLFVGAFWIYALYTLHVIVAAAAAVETYKRSSAKLRAEMATAEAQVPGLKDAVDAMRASGRDQRG